MTDDTQLQMHSDNRKNSLQPKQALLLVQKVYCTWAISEQPS